MYTEKKNNYENYIRTDIPSEFNELSIIKNNFNRLMLNLEGKIVPPYEVLIHVTSSCNLSCRWCIGKNLENTYSLVENRLLQNDNLIKLVKSIASYKRTFEFNDIPESFGVKRVSFSGITGEPLIAGKVLLEAINYLSNHGIETGIFTNGILITKDTYETLLKMNYILISLDAGTKETYSKLKAPDKKEDFFGRVIENIMHLNNEKIKANSKLEINVGFVINEYNYMEVFNAAEILKKIGVRYLRIKTDIANKLNIKSEQISIINKQIERIKNELEDDTFGIVLLHRIGNEKDKKRNFNKCYINRLMSAVSADGKMYACNYHPSINGIVFGDVVENDFSYVWENANFDVNVCAECPSTCDPFKNRANNLINALINSNDNIVNFSNL